MIAALPFCRQRAQDALQRFLLRGIVGEREGFTPGQFEQFAVAQWIGDVKAEIAGLARAEEFAGATELQVGFGEFFGTRQSGDLGFHIANPLRDRELLELARREAFTLADDSAQKETLQRILRTLPAEWQRRYHLAHIG